MRRNSAVGLSADELLEMDTFWKPPPPTQLGPPRAATFPAKTKPLKPSKSDRTPYTRLISNKDCGREGTEKGEGMMPLAVDLDAWLRTPESVKRYSIIAVLVLPFFIIDVVLHVSPDLLGIVLAALLVLVMRR